MALGWRGPYLRYREFFLNVMTLYKKRADLRAFTEIILSISTITIFLIFALKPTALTIIALVNEINQKKATAAALDQKISNIRTADEVYTRNKAVITDLDNALPNIPEPDVISKQAEGLAQKDSVSILGLSVTETTLVGAAGQQKHPTDIKALPANAKEMPISISLQGDYQALISFGKDLENLKIPIKIDNLAISSSVKETASIIVALVSARVPYLGQ